MWEGWGQGWTPRCPDGPQNEAPAILASACVWATHSNIRYQLLNGLDMARPFPQPRTLPPSSLLR